MKRYKLVFALTPMFVSLILGGASCSAGKSNGSSKKPVSTYDPNQDDDDGGGGNHPNLSGIDAAALAMDASFDPLRQVKTPAEGLQVLITAYDNEQNEGDLGQYTGATVAMKAFAGDVVKEGKNGKAR